MGKDVICKDLYIFLIAIYYSFFQFNQDTSYPLFLQTVPCELDPNILFLSFFINGL